MTENAPDDHPPMTIAIEWSTRLTAIGLEMALPAAAGYWADRHAGTAPVFVILGAILGFVIGMFSLLQIAKGQNRKKP